ncbi:MULTISPECIES: LacI family DNA-binding transcriptional regulator [Microbacterium]|uniref:LacI family DNA-binding transcriptional regulator n=1 Tax=Microbacterium TaxID=33882 RepID=UPI00217DD5E7|nr:MULTISPECIES: LacI family DNA-binding transcriptional regulator [Microbacterium]UWF77339.1 LacI family DNA-binding transcriptional regulator [Microbacterium neungamense]WCM55498.1 LacI family DNA-binding transcriptional regulator [Microbacterium sp. EF45047]
MPASVKDVAALAGVSASTVSNYLNHPELLSATTLERVRAAIEELGYVPNESARQLRAGSGKAIALILLDAWLPFFNELSRGVEEGTRDGGWSLFFSNSNRDPAQELRNIEMFEAHRARGIVISPLGDVVPRLERLAARGIRSVVIGPAQPSAAVGFVPFDDVGGGRLAGEHLTALGRRRMAFLGDPEGVRESADRLAGFTDAVGGRAAVQVMRTPGLTIAAGMAAGEEMLRLPPEERPDAVFATNDMLAIGALTVLLRAGVRVPEDVAIVGFDDVDQAHQAIVPLTTVRQPAYEMGRAAASALLRQLEDPGSRAPAVTPFPAELVIRASTARSAR